MTRLSYSVLGLARSGVAAANALHRRGHRVQISDLRNQEALQPYLDRLEDGIEVHLGANVMRAGDVVVVSPGIPPRAPIFAEAKEQQLPVIGEVGLFQELAPNNPIIAISGTDGKSTTTAWVGAMCAAATRPHWVGGNIGIPLCESLQSIEETHVIVAEVSCFQLWTSPRFHPQIAILTNLAPDHLDYYDGSYERYQSAKAAIFANQRAGDVLVVNGDDPILRTWSAPNGARTLWFSKHPLPSDREGVYLEENTLVWKQAGEKLPLVELDDLRLPGAHNIENAMAAASAALAFGLPREKVAEALRDFGGLEHRIERIRTVDGVTYYNDSKATNPHAGEAALRAFNEPIVLLCGGSEKGSDFSDWAALAADHVRHAVCFGATAQRIAEALAGRVPVTCVDTMTDALQAGTKAAGGEGIVVLSPVCASFDQFDNFEHRGRVFKALVEAL